jgi:hypothetical protein
VEDQFFVKSANIGCVKKILQMGTNRAGKQIHFSTQSYKEMMQGLLEKSIPGQSCQDFLSKNPR